MEFSELYLHVWWGWIIFDMILEKNKKLMLVFFFDQKISDFEILEFWNLRFLKMLFFSEFEIFWSKKKLTSKFLVFPKSYQICSILTKHEGITRRTPKVMLIFRFFRCCFSIFPLTHRLRQIPNVKNKGFSEKSGSPFFSSLAEFEHL